MPLGFTFNEMENQMNKQKSAKITAGLRNSFRDGTDKLANRVCYGCTLDESCDLVANEKEASIAHKIFAHYLAGASLGQIADYISECGFPSPTSKSRWKREAPGNLFRNLKCCPRTIKGNSTSDGFFYVPYQFLILLVILRLFKREHLFKPENHKNKQYQRRKNTGETI